MRLDYYLAHAEGMSRKEAKIAVSKGQIEINGQLVKKANHQVSESDNVLLQGRQLVWQQERYYMLHKPADYVCATQDAEHAIVLDLLPNQLHKDLKIVGRLDKDTTGLMVVAKTIPAQTHLVEAMQAREITREYEAVCHGAMTGGGTIDEPIGRHPTKRTHMAVSQSGKPATTHFRVMEKYRAHTRLRLRLETGRTHQIRVHMSFVNHPLVGDPVYAGRPRPPRKAGEALLGILRNFRRQALHAAMLRLAHPVTCEILEWHAPIPEDMVQLTTALRADTAEHGLDFV